jgi:L-arabinokinase
MLIVMDAEQLQQINGSSACRWHAYIQGALLVLMRECGARVPGSLSILIYSAVPEGKGVSSSAALEVSVMSALAAALGITLEGRQLALLCQKVPRLSKATLSH